MSETLKDVFLHHVHYCALAFMAIVYVFKVRWILKYKAPGERTAMPGSMESTAKKPWRWIEFVVLHLGVTIGIGATIAMPHAVGFFWSPTVAWTLRILLAAAFLVGLIRIGRRLFSPTMRVITHPEDLFAIVIITLWLGVAFFGIAPLFGTATSVDAYAHPTDLGAVAVLFTLTSFLIVYVPFSKISHYVFWPFQRYYIGKHLGHRGVFPKLKPAS
jgi:hypothetical protein